MRKFAVHSIADGNKHWLTTVAYTLNPTQAVISQQLNLVMLLLL